MSLNSEGPFFPHLNISTHAGMLKRMKKTKGGNTMTVIINKLTKSGVKTISGKLISDGLGVITAAVLNSQGSYSIKRFKKENIANYQIID